jgi:hypothetical protein
MFFKIHRYVVKPSIFMARVGWQSSAGKYIDIAQTFRFVGRMHEAAALSQRNNPADRLQISDDSTSG